MPSRSITPIDIRAEVAKFIFIDYIISIKLIIEGGWKAALIAIMKILHYFLISLFLSSIFNNNSFAEIDIRLNYYPPTLVGLPNAMIAGNANGWYFKYPEGQIFVIPLQHERMLRNVLNPAAGELDSRYLNALLSMSLPPKENIPQEFYAVPYAKGKSIHAYLCGYSSYENKVICRLMPLSTQPVGPNTPFLRFRYNPYQRIFSTF